MIFKTSTLLSHHKTVAHRFTSRIGGYSQEPYYSNNLAFHVGDKAEDVIKNHDILANQLGYERQKLVHMRQVHSDLVLVVDAHSDNFKNPPECDALVTDLPNTPLMVMVADCTPVLFFEPQSKIIAVAHAGRKGALSEIVPKTIETMVSRFHAKKESIQVILGPSIHSCCYEIDEDIALEVSESGYRDALRIEGERHFLNINTIIRQQLKKLELPQKNIEDLNICNACHNKTFFSYRADAKTTGRCAGVIMIKP